MRRRGATLAEIRATLGVPRSTLAARNRPAWPILIFLAAANAPNIIRNTLSNSHRGLWICVGFGYVVLAVGAWLVRQRTILVTARKHVRESANWPLLAQRRDC
jgi:hypothetical protein